MKRNPVDIDAWAALGMLAAPDGHDVALIYIGIAAPVLDLYGSKDLPQVLAGAALRRASLQGNPASKQVVIAGSDHFYAGHENDMIKAVVDFLDGLK
jgi:pimeloyl-ACP methyl ester carboxylesterase